MKVAVIGSGFAGIGMGVALQRAGLGSFAIFDRAERVGGVWRDNTYPGLTCDVPSHLYSFSFEPKRDWTKRFSPREEILAYLDHCVAAHGLDEHLRLGTDVTRAAFDEDARRWRLETAAGETIEADVVITATGQLSRPSIPRIPGLERFEGRAFHSARWEHDHVGRRVAAVGTGASAIQYIPEIAEQVGRLDVYQRSAPWVIPKMDRDYPERARRLVERVPLLQNAARLGFWAYFEVLITGFVGPRVVLAPVWLSHKAMLYAQVRDRRLRRALKPDYPLGCKRVLISSDYYKALAQPNVELVTDAIREVTPGGIVTEDGVERPADTIIFGTGFRSTEFLAPMEVRGLGGRELNDAWRDGAEAFLGMAVSGFPNFFMLYGPNTNLGSGSIIYMLESQIRYAIEAVRAVSSNGRGYLDVRPEVQREFDREMQRRLSDSVWSGCSSWYRTESGRVTNNWPGYMYEYRRRTRRLEPADYRLVA
ncbi:MAG TPA: NAD(P)/FAD-dependent oxidoreductase [Solirubrobacteraceae bacterium]